MEMETDKNTARHKAFNEMSDLFLRRIEEISEIAEKSKSLPWLTFFKAACRGVRLQAQKIAEATGTSSQKPLENKNSVYQLVLEKVVSYGNKLYEHVPILEIFKECVEAFQTKYMIESFGATFYNILDQSIFKCPTALKGITRSHWMDLVDAIFGLYAETCIPDERFEMALFNVINVGLTNFQVNSIFSIKNLLIFDFFFTAWKHLSTKIRHFKRILNN